MCTLCLLFVLLSSCGRRQEEKAYPEADTLVLNYASNLTIVEADGLTLVSLRNPWDTTKTLHRYVLIPHDSRLTAAEMPEGTVVRVPLERPVVYTALHCGLMEELGVLESVVGVCDLKYIQIPWIHQACREGRVGDLGSAMAPNLERMIALKPDGILLSPFENNGGYGRVDQFGVPIIECADYMETSPLGRAEWIRFYGRLFGQAEKSDSLFCMVEQAYLRWKEKAGSSISSLTVFCDLPINGSTWYMPGGCSTIGQLYADAGASYLFAEDRHTGSIPLSLETVFDKAGQADMWLIRYGAAEECTYASLQEELVPYTHFKAFQERQVYVCNTLNVPFYEEVPFHPERLLRDLVLIFHPSLSDGDSLRYYKPMK